MPSNSAVFVVDESATINAPVHLVWHAIVDSEARSGWWSYLDLDAKPGGRFEEHWTDQHGQPKRTYGYVSDLIECVVLRLSWADNDWPAATEVEVRLHEADRATTVQVRHTGWERLPGGADLAEQHRAGWKMHLSNLRDYLHE